MVHCRELGLVPMREIEAELDRILSVLDELFCRGHRLRLDEILFRPDHPLVAGKHAGTLAEYQDDDVGGQFVLSFMAPSSLPMHHHALSVAPCSGWQRRLFHSNFCDGS